MRYILIVIFSIISISVKSQVIEFDDVYYVHSDRVNDTIKVKKKKWWGYNYSSSYVPNYYYQNYRPFGYSGWGSAYGYPYEFYRSRTIVIVPKNDFDYGKRPSREDFRNTSPRQSNRRGRD